MSSSASSSSAATLSSRPSSCATAAESRSRASWPLSALKIGRISAASSPRSHLRGSHGRRHGSSSRVGHPDLTQNIGQTPPERHIDAELPGEKVQLDCFYVGRLSGTKGTVWQYSAIDIASAFAWAELSTSERNPRARHTRELLHRVATELKAAGWRLQEVTTDNGSEFRSKVFRGAVDDLGARQRFIKAGNPNSNGCVERLQLTILEECWRPAFARALIPKITGLQRDLDEYLHDYNHDRAHTGRLTQGRLPADIVYGARKQDP